MSTARRLGYALLAVAGLVAGWVAADLRAAPDALVCETEAVPLTPKATLWLSGPGELTGLRGTFEAHGDASRLTFLGALPEGAGEIEAPGYLPAAVTWSRGRCEVALAPAAVVVGTVSPPHGDLVVLGCDRQVVPGSDGSFYLEVAPEPCSLRAVRRDGALAAEGPEAKVNPVLGQDTTVDLVLPEPTGGVGVRFWVDDQGARVEALFPGGAAEAAGIAVGDVIVAVDGKPTAGLSQRDFARITIGPVGSQVTLTVRSGEATREVVLTRANVVEPE